MQEKKTVRDTFLRVVALLGVILVLLLGAWGIILLAFNLSSIVANVGSSITSLVAGVGSAEGEALSIDTPDSPIASGANLPVSWEHVGKDGEYSYTLSYACATGLSIKAPTPAGKQQTVACDAPFNYVNAASSMVLVAQNSGKQAVDTVVTVFATRLSDGAITTSASAEVTVNPATTAAPVTPTVTTGSTGGTYYAAPRVASMYGYGDLAVRIISVNSARSTYGLNTAQFEVVNAGSNMVPAGWNFEADLPINGGYEYNSPTQKALYPGDKIVYTLSFNGGYDNDRHDNRYDDERYEECGDDHDDWDQEDWFDWYQDTWDTSSDSREDWDTDEWEDWYDEYCDDYEDEDRDDDRYTSGTLRITADPRNYVRELNEGNNTVTARVN